MKFYFIFGAILISTAACAQDIVPGRAIEYIAYPYKNFNFISPRYDRVNNTNDTYFETYLLRIVSTVAGKNHFRLDLPFAKTNATDTRSTTFGFSDLSARYTRVIARTKNTFYGVGCQVVLPTASNSFLGSNVYQFRPGAGGFYIFPGTKGSIYFATEYRFSITDKRYPGVHALAFSPNVDWWFKGGYMGYYATWVYDIKNGRWDIPVDVEAGYAFVKNLTLSAEYILPLLSTRTYNNEFSIKLRYNWR